MKKLLPASKGFTLIELMVVVTIIAFLSVIGIVAFTNAQSQARDGKRRADIEAIATALEANFDAVNGKYPTDAVAEGGTLMAGSTIPVDPGGNEGVLYSIQVVPPDQKTYTVCAKLEKANGNATLDGDGITFTSSSGSTALWFCRKNQQ